MNFLKRLLTKWKETEKLTQDVSESYLACN
jgi:hypothetical protein